MGIIFQTAFIIFISMLTDVEMKWWRLFTVGLFNAQVIQQQWADQLCTDCYSRLQTDL